MGTMPEAQVNFIRNIKRLMEEAGLNQRELADKMGVHESTMSSWVQGVRFPRSQFMAKIAEAFHVDASDLIHDNSVKSGLPTSLDLEERQLVKQFQSLSEVQRQVVLDVIASILKHS